MSHSLNASSKTDWKTITLASVLAIQEGLLLQFHLIAERWQEKQRHTAEQPVHNLVGDRPCRSPTSRLLHLYRLWSPFLPTPEEEAAPKKLKLHLKDCARSWHVSSAASLACWGSFKGLT